MQLVATRRDERTVVDTLRQEGLARCSRPFRLPGGGARVVTMQLGPGYVRGDRFTCTGSVGAQAELAVTAQAATRALGRGDESAATALWSVGAGGTLRLIGEPLVLYAGARHRSETEIELGAGATFAFLDVIAASATFARVATRLRLHSGGRLLLHDALVLTPERLRRAIGSAFFIRTDRLAPNTTPQADASLLGAADARAREASLRYAVRIGIGSPACGGLSVRAVGDSAASVHAALNDVLSAISDPPASSDRDFPSA